ncbi:MAG: 5'/3'-nucleotidase SurE [Bacteroidetes bacterium]|nr:5'/3'-nucleotidase SurE [Bacteroidota bacterium]
MNQALNKTIQKPLILVTNDDGVTSKGILSLVNVAKEFGTVIVIAPDKPQSGMGHAITISHPLRLSPVDLFESVETYSCSGTPVDCVKLGVYEVLHQKPDLILSGINHGENTSTNVLYSGTMSAAVEGAMENIPSIGFSLKDFNPEADFSASQIVARKIIKKVLAEGLPDHTCLNVNIPKVRPEELKGIKWCKQAEAFWDDRFDKRFDQFGRPYYWLTGDFECTTDDIESDLYAMKNGFASIVPTQFDLTNYKALALLKKWKL